MAASVKRDYLTDASRKRRFADDARRAHYAAHRAQRFARRMRGDAR